MMCLPSFVMQSMSTLPPAISFPLQAPPTPGLDPDDAVDRLMAQCLRNSSFGPEKDFWDAFARAYARMEARVDPQRRFAFAVRVDSRLAQMGLAPWSVMSRIVANATPGAGVAAP